MDSTNSNNIDFGLPATDHYPNDEGQDLEYKSAQGGFPADFWKTYSAFANSFGGDIILGVSEKKGRIKFEGLNAEQIGLFQRLFWDNANNPNTISINLLNNDDVNVIEADGKNLLVFSIPAATRTQKPVYLTRNPFGNTYKRNHEGDYRCTREEVTRMLADADINAHHDS